MFLGFQNVKVKAIPGHPSSHCAFKQVILLSSVMDSRPYQFDQLGRPVEHGKSSSLCTNESRTHVARKCPKKTCLTPTIELWNKCVLWLSSWAHSQCGSEFAKLEAVRSTHCQTPCEHFFGDDKWL